MEEEQEEEGGEDGTVISITDACVCLFMAYTSTLCTGTRTAWGACVIGCAHYRVRTDTIGMSTVCIAVIARVAK